MADAARLRITLVDLDPAPWREIDVPLSMSFKGLHDSIQAAFLWLDAHLWEFDLGDLRYGPEADAGFGGPPVGKVGAARLRKLAENDIRTFFYTYDFGDNWTHRIDVQEFFAAAPDDLLPRYRGGKWRTPPEDVGGPPGFEYFLAALADPDHPEHAELLEWRGGPFDAEDVEEDVLRIQLRRVARARRTRR